MLPGKAMIMREIKEEFLKKVLENGWEDTQNYRYVVKENGLFNDIIRIRKEYLGTIKVYETWEPVCSYVKQITAYDN